MTIKEFFSFKTNKYFWVNILVMIVAVVLIVFGVMKWLDVYTRHGEAVVVPDVKGMTVDEASKCSAITGWYVSYPIPLM